MRKATGTKTGLGDVLLNASQETLDLAEAISRIEQCVLDNFEGAGDEKSSVAVRAIQDFDRVQQHLRCLANFLSNISKLHQLPMIDISHALSDLPLESLRVRFSDVTFDRVASGVPVLFSDDPLD